MPVALVIYRGAGPGRLSIVPLSAALVVAGERLFGFGYGTAADWHTVLALAVALTFTNLLVGGFAMYARTTELQLQHNALHDPLTGLPNRALFMDRLERALARCRRSRQVFATLFLDLDRFKIVNDGLGHGAGDALLIATARRIARGVREEDTVARIGGDEFIVLLENVGDVREATRTADRIQALVREPVTLSGYDVSTSASIGIALCANGETRADALLRDADTAMYRAKANGRARAEIFGAEMSAEALRLLQLETDLRHAIDRGEFVLEYQPIVRADGSGATAFEALVRWRHPRLGRLMPADFLPLAEDNGMSIALGNWVVRDACGTMRAWHDAAAFPSDNWRVSINVSPRQLTYSGLAASIAGILRETEAPARRLAVEVTESAVMNAPTVMSEMIALKKVGVELWMDDFGTGYSSLNHLHQFPFDVLKVDRSFIQDVGIGSPPRAIVRTIVALARQLNLAVIAEGIETCEQWDAIRALGCDAGQGYYFAAPMEAGLLPGVCAAWGRAPMSAPSSRSRAAP